MACFSHPGGKMQYVAPSVVVDESNDHLEFRMHFNTFIHSSLHLSEMFSLISSDLVRLNNWIHLIKVGNLAHSYKWGRSHESRIQRKTIKSQFFPFYIFKDLPEQRRTQSNIYWCLLYMGFRRTYLFISMPDVNADVMARIAGPMSFNYIHKT